MREISSRDNKIFKQAAELSQRKYRDRSGLYLIEGDNLLLEAVTNGADIKTVFLRDGCERLSDALRDAVEDKCFVLSGELFDRITQTETAQGIMAIVKKPEIPDVHGGAELAEAFKDVISDGGNVVVLDRLQDPGNIGTVIRTADACGYKLAVMMKGTADCYSPKAVRAATGSLFRMPVVYMDSVEELAEFADTAGKKLAASCLDADCCFYDADLKRDVALIIGNEGNGISDELIERSDIKIKIPMAGGTESLNASIAAAILMYEAVRP